MTAGGLVKADGVRAQELGKAPKDLAEMSAREAAHFMMDVVSYMEKNWKRGGYISSVMRPLKSWFAWNENPIGVAIAGLTSHAAPR